MSASITRTLIIREAGDSDLPAIIRIYAASGIDGTQSFTDEEARQHFKSFREYPNYRLFVASLRRQLVGAYSLLIMDNLAKRGARSGIVEDLAVLPSHQRQGIGRAIMQHALEQCRLAGCYKLALSSNLNREAAHRFYDSLGFERHGFSFAIRL